MAAKYAGCVAKLTSIRAQVKSLQDFGLEAAERREDRKIKLLKVKAKQLEKWTAEHEKEVNKVFLMEGKPSTYDESQFNKSITEFDDMVAEIRLCLEEVGGTGEVTSIVNGPQGVHQGDTTVRLPKISIPLFEGKASEWTSFIALFDSLIGEKKNLHDVEKLHYLRASLNGEPLDLIKGLSLTNESYTVAMSLLRDRYENLRKIATTHADKLINLPSSQIASAKHIRVLIAAYREHIESLRAVKVIPPSFEGTLDGLFLFLILLRKLDSTTRCNFERGIESNKTIPSPDELIRFLERECQALEASQETARTTMVRKPEMRTTALPTEVRNKCAVCQKRADHRVFQCSSYLKKSVPQRKRVIQDNRLCFNCLGEHLVVNCPSTNRCKACSARHHSSIHVWRDNVNEQPVSEEAEDELEGDEEETSVSGIVQASHAACHASDVILSTVTVGVRNVTGQYEIVRALLDNGSQASYVTADCVQRLGLRVRRTDTKISGISQQGVTAKGVVSLGLCHRTGGKQMMNVDAFVLKKITGKLPSAPLPEELHQCLDNLGIGLADPRFFEPQTVDCLLGADVFVHILINERIELGVGKPVILNTLFGWVVMGSYADSATERQEALVACHALVEPPMEDILQQFWKTEEPTIPHTYSVEDKKCEQHFVENVSRDTEGKYIVKLPFRDMEPLLGSSYHLAESRFFALERRLSKDQSMCGEYQNFLEEYLASGHMELAEIPADIDNQVQHYFLPHHGILKPSSSTTKLRVVFDASAGTSGKGGFSLNDILMKGPKLQKDITEIFIRFRFHAYALVADIKQMFRGIWVHPRDRDHQLILWRRSPNEPLQVYRLKTVTFGVSCSPFLAMRTLLQLTYDEGKSFPDAVRVIQNDVFVDDIVTGSCTIEDGLKLQNELIQLLQRAGFVLRKWASNSDKLLEGIAEHEREIPVSFLHPEGPLLEVLGMGWNSVSDCFVYSAKARNYPVTKRGVLSCIARMYDPLGLLTPVTFWTKSLLQRLWVSGLDWDEPLTEELASKWNAFIMELPQLAGLSVPRYMGSADGEVHGFCDASEKGYAAAVYFLARFGENEKRVLLLLAKSKVAPLKQVSLPRLELCGAHLLAKLLKFCSESLATTVSISRTIAWSDSTTVLGWVRTPPYVLKTFVANRVAEIQTWVPTSIWRHVPSGDNPADCASRGLYPAQLRNSQWFHGPSFLLKDETEWPTVRLPPVDLEVVPERRPHPLNLLASTVPGSALFFQNFSSWPRMLRVFALALRFLHNCRHRVNRRYGPVSCSELRIVEMGILRAVQAQTFQADISALNRGVSCSTRLQRLSPFLDQAGILRVGGRLEDSALSYAARHPVLLPKDHCVTHMLVDHYHRVHLHAGPRLLQSLLARRYWILSFRATVRKRIYKCVPCFRHKPRNTPPFMADLPRGRVRPARPFSSTNVDYAGPFVGRTHKGSKGRAKMYLCLFICTATKAVHLEAVSSMTTDAFLASLRRFMARRGWCRDIYCDRGTNFVGASAELRKMFRTMNSEPNCEILSREMADRGIVWHFRPPSAPHFGGLHEAAIRLAKHHINRVMGKQVLTFEEMQTLLRRSRQS